MAVKHGNLSINSENLFPIIKKWLYSDHDIFYRELISNGCDAITKLKKLDMMGEYQLPADYKQQKYTEYNLMCPEWNIDASTCAKPFNTWFISGLGHAKKNEDYKKFVDEIVYKDLDIFTDPNRPQYLRVSESDPEMLEPIVVVEEEETLYTKLWNIIRQIVLFPINVVNKLIGKNK